MGCNLTLIYILKGNKNIIYNLCELSLSAMPPVYFCNPFFLNHGELINFVNKNHMFANSTNSHANIFI